MGAPALIGSGMVIGGLGDLLGAQAGADAAEYNLKQTKEDNKLLDLSTMQQRGALRRQGARDIAEMKVSALKSGVTLEGSPADAIALSIESLARDDLTIARNAELEKQGALKGAKLQQHAARSEYGALPFRIGARVMMGVGAM